jgi:hypothetical protein
MDMPAVECFSRSLAIMVDRLKTKQALENYQRLL